MTVAAHSQSRISQRFAALRASGEMGIVAYITAGDPSFAATQKFVVAMAEAGVDVIELGVPFSDPLADGPTIQRASERALKNGATLAKVIDLVREIRNSKSPASEVPIVLFTYYNPIFQMGLEKFAACSFRRRSRRRPRHRHHARRIRRLSPHSRSASSRHRFSRRANFHRRAPRKNRRLLFRLSLSHLPHRSHRSKRRAPRRSARIPAPRPQRNATSHRRRLRHLAPRPRLRFGRTSRRRSSRLRLVSEIEKATASNSSAAAIDTAANALADRIRSLKSAARTGLSRREVAT